MSLYILYHHNLLSIPNLFIYADPGYVRTNDRSRARKYLAQFVARESIDAFPLMELMQIAKLRKTLKPAVRRQKLAPAALAILKKYGIKLRGAGSPADGVNTSSSSPTAGDEEDGSDDDEEEEADDVVEDEGDHDERDDDEEDGGVSDEESEGSEDDEESTDEETEKEMQAAIAKADDEVDEEEFEEEEDEFVPQESPADQWSV